MKLGDCPWSGVYDCVVVLVNISLSGKVQETVVASVVRKHVVSDHFEATDRIGKSHATLLIWCVPNVTK